MSAPLPSPDWTPSPSSQAVTGDLAPRWTGWLGTLGLVGAIVALRGTAIAPGLATALVVASAGLPMLVADFWRTGLRAPQHSFDRERVAHKLVGLLASLAGLAGLWWALPEYHGSFYQPAWNLLTPLLGVVLVLAVPYVAWTDVRMEQPRDGLWHLGTWLVGPRQQANREVVRRHALGWLVKAFFLPLMLVYLEQDLVRLQARQGLPTDFLGWFDHLWLWLFTLDVGLAATGYLLTLRAVGSHLRSAEPTVLGWVACLVCYQPFWSVIEGQYLRYEDDLAWRAWLADLPVVQTAWALAILACVLVYAWATVSFGLRFSNLTHRGIVTHGPYRWLRHPAYVAKNLSWWLVAIPFMSRTSSLEALRHSLLLLALGGVYWLRARTEEAHLGQDPTYRAYVAWIDQHGLWARIRRRVRP